MKANWEKLRKQTRKRVRYRHILRVGEANQFYRERVVRTDGRIICDNIWLFLPKLGQIQWVAAYVNKIDPTASCWRTFSNGYRTVAGSTSMRRHCACNTTWTFEELSYAQAVELCPAIQLVEYSLSMFEDIFIRNATTTYSAADVSRYHERLESWRKDCERWGLPLAGIPDPGPLELRRVSGAIGEFLKLTNEFVKQKMSEVSMLRQIMPAVLSEDKGE